LAGTLFFFEAESFYLSGREKIFGRPPRFFQKNFLTPGLFEEYFNIGSFLTAICQKLTG
jgi:hypothetical protein